MWVLFFNSRMRRLNAMPFQPVPQVIQAELVYNWDQQVVENVLHYQSPGPVTATDMSELCLELIDWYNANLKTLHPTTISLVAVKATDLNSASAPAVVITTGLPLVGTAASASMPNHVALTMTKRTALRGKSHRGRLYHPGLVEANCTGNNVIGANVSGLVTIYNLLRTLTTTVGGWELVVVSRVQEGITLVAGEFTPVTNFTSDGVIDSQRRRLPGRGA